MALRRTGSRSWPRATLFWFGALAFGLGLIACISTPEASYRENLESKKMAPPDGKALVYIIRPVQGYDSIGMIPVIDRKQHGTLYGGTYQMIEVDPGLHKAACLAGENLKTLEFEAEAGRIYFIKVTRSIGWTAPRVGKFHRIPDAEGRKFVETYSRAAVTPVR